MSHREDFKGRARALHNLLKKYAEIDEEAEMVLGFMEDFFEEIERGFVSPPLKNKYIWHFSNSESPLFKYEDLRQAHAVYSLELEGLEE
jgi:hypothetical protein